MFPNNVLHIWIFHFSFINLKSSWHIQKLLGEYTTWLESSNTHEGMLYKESFERRWPLFVNQNRQLHMESLKSLKKANELSLGVIRDFKGTAASKLFDQEIREVVGVQKSFSIISCALLSFNKNFPRILK